MRTSIERIILAVRDRNDLAQVDTRVSGEGKFVAAKFNLGKDLISEWVILHPLTSDAGEEVLRVVSFYPFEVPAAFDGYRFCQDLTEFLTLGVFQFQPSDKRPVRYLHQQLTTSSLLTAGAMNSFIDEAPRAEVVFGCAFARLAALSGAAQRVASVTKQTNPVLN